MSLSFNPEDLGFNYTGRCTCAGRPMRYRMGFLQLKVWDNRDAWQLLNSGNIVRYGTIQSMEYEVKEYLERVNAQ